MRVALILLGTLQPLNNITKPKITHHPYICENTKKPATSNSFLDPKGIVLMTKSRYDNLKTSTLKISDIFQV